MRQPKTFLLLSIIVAVLVLAVGYAAISNVTFNINGTATATGDAANFKVAFTSFEKSGDGIITGEASGQTASFDVSGLTTKGQKAILEFNIENSSEDIYAELTAPYISNSNSSYFGVYAHYVGTNSTHGMIGTPYEGVYIDYMQPKSTATLYVEVTLLKTPTDDVSTNIKVDFTAIPQSNAPDLNVYPS